MGQRGPSVSRGAAGVLLPVLPGEGWGGGIGRLFWLCGWFEAGAGASSRQPSHFLLSRQKKVTKEKATPLRVTLRFATGNLRCSLQAGSAQTRFAQTRAALYPPEAALLGTRRGEWDGPLLRSAANGLAARDLGQVLAYVDEHGHRHEHEHEHEHVRARVRLRLRVRVRVRVRECQREQGSEAQANLQTTEGRACGALKFNPLWPRRGAQLFAEKGPRVFEPKASLRGPREKRAPQVARSEAEGRGQWGRLFFGYFLLARQKKVTRLPGRRPGSSLTTTATYESTARVCPHPSPLPKREGARP
ncbi:hypothetical protein H4CHR_01802 [Variovorax sp. PBS-H4]|nr:hypothetical protein H4CHR_01802 [Variovorax sp. PBS-H4]